MLRFWTVIRFLLFVPLLCTCGEGIATKSAAPGVSGATSTTNADGSVTVAIVGTGFVTGITVTVNGTNCSNVNVVSTTSLTCTLPSDKIPLTNIVVTTSGGGSNAPTTLSSPIISTSASASSTPSGWTNIIHAKTNDGQVATSDVLGNGDSTPNLFLTGYFSDPAYKLPSSATIDGIVVNCKWADSSGLSDGIVGIVKNNVQQTFHPAGGLLTFLTLTLDVGSASDKWGTTWTPSDINAAGFGIWVEVNENGTGVVTVDYCQLAVYWH